MVWLSGGQLAFRALHVNLNLYRRTVMMLPVAELGLGIRKYFNDIHNYN